MPINDPKVKARIVRSLCNRLLEEPNSSVRCTIVSALAKIGSEEALPQLLQALEDEDTAVRQMAAEAIGTIGCLVENSNIEINQVNIYGNVSVIQHSVEATVQVQKILNQIAQNRSIDTESIAQWVEREIEQNPTLKTRLIGALKAGGIEALKAIFNHPFVSVPIELIMGFLEPE